MVFRTPRSLLQCPLSRLRRFTPLYCALPGHQCLGWEHSWLVPVPWAHHCPAVYPWRSGPSIALWYCKRSVAAFYWQDHPNSIPFPILGHLSLSQSKLFLFLLPQAISSGPISSGVTLTWAFGNAVKIWGSNGRRRF